MRSCICLFINLFIAYKSIGQTVLPTGTLTKPSVTAFPSLQFFTASLRADTTNSISLYHNLYTLMESNYYTSTLGFFCQKEIQIEKALKFPLRLRLGSVAFTDKMEGKGAGFSPPGFKK